jgi:very-short-patch-repair endonuclease
MVMWYSRRCPDGIDVDQKEYLVRLIRANNCRKLSINQKYIHSRTDPIICEKRRLARVGRIATEITRKKMSLRRMGVKFTEGHKNKIRFANTGKIRSEEVCKKISVAKLGKKLNLNDKQRIKRIEHNRKIQHLAADGRVTKIELKVQNQLRSKGIEFICQKQIKNRFYDIYIPSMNLLIECDGDYWHSLDRQKPIDELKNELAKFEGYKLIRLSESCINLKRFDIYESIKNAC